MGHLEDLPADPLSGLMEGVEKTSRNTGLNLNLALSYGGRAEILDATRAIAQDVREGKITSGDINEQLFSKYLYTRDMPDPDLLIRTSGELRLSNFLLWQMAYTEIYVTNTYWPDFRKRELLLAIQDFQKRERRFGKTSEQITHPSGT
jgi:undecaprenyl diphosphate synthase